ncbi:ABC transporter substrate-binding protein [Dongia sp.]|uniref:ABC transporter substrate-binding protein n=1 Tax=Dongia sp. TaxID=1977262 RepID=UPI0037514630
MTRTILARLTFSAGALAVAVSAFGMRVAAQDADRPMVIARDMDLNSLDPARAICDTCQIYLSSVYDRLVDLGKDNKTIVPLIADKWTINDRQTELTFHLDPRAKFSDGSPVEAKDVKWSLERLKNIKGSMAYLVDAISAIEATDAHTVKIVLAAPNSEFLGSLTAPYTGILNSDLAGENGATSGTDADTKDQAENWFVANSAGAGPYQLKSYSPGSELRLVRNENYWRNKPAVKELVFQQIKEPIAQVQALQAGNADIAMQVDPDTAQGISDPNISVETAPSFNFVYVALSPGAKGGEALTAEVREAIAYAIDYKGTIDLILGGRGQRQASPIANGFPGSAGLEPVQTDLEKAKSLMAKAGAKDLTFTSIYPNVNQYGVNFTTMMQKVQIDLAKIGIKLELQPTEFPVWREHVNGEGVPVTAVFFAPDYFGSAQYIQYFGLFDGTVWFKRSGAAKNPALARPKEGEILAKALASGGDESARAFGELAKMMQEDRIILPIANPDNILVYRKEVAGVRYSACCNLPTSELSWK